MLRSRSIFEIDLYITLATIALVVIGILFVYSSGVTANGELVSREYLRQIAWASSGIVLMLVLTFFDYRVFSRPAPVIFGVSLLILIITLAFGRIVNGARSWIGIGELGGQPSEFTKIALILMLAWYFGHDEKRIRSLPGFLGGLLIALVPVGMVLLQPDLGTAMVYVPIFLFVAFAAGVPMVYIGFVFGVGALTVVFTVLPVWRSYEGMGGSTLVQVLVVRENLQFLILGVGVALLLAVLGFLTTKRRMFFWLAYFLSIALIALPLSYIARSILQDYQIMRLIVFLDPYVDPRGAGWNIIQSTTAVGSGGPFGKGFLKGTQSHYQYLPQQSTDFIFSILAEEWGFIGILAVFSLFGIIFGRSIYIMASARDRFASLIVAGVLGMFMFHFVINVGMAVGIMPITGIPLLLLSYGGSSLWTAMSGIGLVMSVYQHRYQY